jgi:hypothetical protein
MNCCTDSSSHGTYTGKFIERSPRDGQVRDHLYESPRNSLHLWDNQEILPCIGRTLRNSSICSIHSNGGREFDDSDMTYIQVCLQNHSSSPVVHVSSVLGLVGSVGSLKYAEEWSGDVVCAHSQIGEEAGDKEKLWQAKLEIGVP